MASRVTLSQVIGSLLGNAAEAIAATGRGSGSITLTIEDAGGTVEMRIRDNREGFEATAGATLFQRGFPLARTKWAGWGCIGAPIR